MADAAWIVRAKIEINMVSNQICREDDVAAACSGQDGSVVANAELQKRVRRQPLAEPVKEVGFHSLDDRRLALSEQVASSTLINHVQACHPYRR